MAIKKTELSDSTASLYIISSIMRRPLLLEDEKYILTQNDFCQPLQQIIFTAIFNMAKQGISIVTPQDVDLYLKTFPTQYEYYEQHKGYQLLLDVYNLTEKSDPSQFDFFYDRVKKFSILRDLDANGFDVKRFYNTDEDFLNRDLEDEKLNALKLAEIPNQIREILVELENKHIGKDEGTSKNALEGLRELIEEFKVNPEIGLPLDGDILNFAVRGARLGKLYIYSAPSGQGKAIPNNTIIPTAFNGFKRVDEIKTGDFLIDRRGYPTKVLGVFPQGELDLYKITFLDGREAFCNNEHLWTYQYGDMNRSRLKTSTLQDIIDEAKKIGYEINGIYNFRVPANQAINYKEKEFNVDMFDLGKTLAAKKAHDDISIKPYLLGSVIQRYSLLNGLFAGLGDCNIMKHPITFVSTNKELIADLKLLAYSLGFGAACFNDSNLVFSHTKFNPIVNIEAVGKKVPMTCFMVDNVEHLFLMNDYIVTHNTRFMVGNACAISLPYIENGKIIVREGLEKVLFVATEMSADEIQTLILAYVSGVNEEKILLGSYSPSEEDRIKLAIEIIEQYGENFIIESMPDPSRAAIRAKMTKYIIQDGINYVFYDYIFSSPGLLTEFRDLEVREDVALMMMSNTLKELAMTYNVFIQSATQLNGNWEKNNVRNANLIRGSKAIVDKVDIGLIGVRLTDEERNNIKDIIEVRRDIHEPNIVMDLYKNRRGKMTSIKIFRYFDFGTCRAEDLFVTDSSYRIYTENGKDCIARYKTHTYDTLERAIEGGAVYGIQNA